MLWCQNKSKTRSQFWHFSISKKAQLPAIRKTEQPILLTKSEGNRPGYNFSEYFRQKRALKSRTRSPLRRIQRSLLKCISQENFYFVFRWLVSVINGLSPENVSQKD